MPTPSSTLPITLPTTLHCRPHDKEQQRKTVTPYMGERRYWGWQRTSGEGMPAFLFLSLITLKGHDGGGVYPFSVVFASTQTWREGETPSPLCFFPHKCDERGFPLLHCVSFHTDTMSRGFPLSVVFLFTQTWRGGGNPSSIVFWCIQTWREGDCPLSVVLSISMRRGGGTSSCHVEHHFQWDEEGETSSCRVEHRFDVMRRVPTLSAMSNSISAVIRRVPICHICFFIPSTLREGPRLGPCYIIFI